MTGTEMLGQQELLEPPPVRRLQVAEGQTSHWGADSSTTRLAVACAETKQAATCYFSQKQGAERLSGIYADTVRFVRALLADGWPSPGVVAVEQPSGSSQAVNLPLIMAVGVITAGIYDGLYKPMAPVRVEPVVSSHWKLVATGKGNAYKPTKKKLGRPPVQRDYAVFCWAEANGWTPSSWDESDAAGMAEAARREIALVPR